MTNTPDVQKQVLNYYQLLQSGMPAKEAFAQAFPNGIPTAQDRAKDQAAAQQKAGYGQVGGILIGALGAKGISDAVAGKSVLGMGKLGGATPTTPVAPALPTAAPAAEPGSQLVSALGGGQSTAASTIPEGMNVPAGYEAVGTASDGSTMIAPMGAEAGAEEGAIAPGSATFAAYGIPVAAAVGTYLAGKSAYDELHGKTDNSAQGLAGRAQLGFTTMGLSEVARPFLNHQTTRATEKKQWGALANDAPDDATKGYANQYLQYLDSDQAKADGGKDFDELKSSGQLKPEDVWGGAGMFQTFGSDWLNHYSPDQRKQISQSLIDNGLLGSHKGGIVVTDADAARTLANQIVPPPGAQMTPQGIQGMPRTPYNVAAVKQTGQLGSQLATALGLPAASRVRPL